MKQDFLNYIKNEFSFTDEEIKSLEENLSKPLKKSIRVNTRKISIDDFCKLAKSKWWELTPTNVGTNMFYIDRFWDELDTALWNTLEHISGYFYVQEVAASSSPFYMSGYKIDNTPYLILDMSASPWWKTTQLSEYYPESIIIANEIDKQRLKWLFINLDRMSSLNVIATNYDARFFKNQEELFDKILLDAPCSWEWTAYKTDDSLKYWNIKNIKAIVKLQISLLDSALKSVKVWWEIVYSTCTLNRLENEWVVEEILKRYPECVEIVPLQKSTKNLAFMEWTIRNWPHIDNTWWFFVVKMKKTGEIKTDNSKWEWQESKKKNTKEIVQNFEKLSSKEIRLIESFLLDNFDYQNEKLRYYRYKSEIHVIDKNADDLWKKVFFYKVWVKIWKIENWEFEPDFNLWSIELFKKNIEVDKDTLRKLYMWEEIEMYTKCKTQNKTLEKCHSEFISGSLIQYYEINQSIKDSASSPEWKHKTIKDWYYQISCNKIPAWIIKVKNLTAKSLIWVKIK